LYDISRKTNESVLAGKPQNVIVEIITR